MQKGLPDYLHVNTTGREILDARDVSPVFFREIWEGYNPTCQGGGVHSPLQNSCALVTRARPEME